MIVLPAFMGIGIELWKISKAMKVTAKSTFPFISVEDKESYSENDTAKYDKTAITYLSYAMFPLLLCYSVYSLLYQEHKGWYSFVFSTLVGGVYVFGFITMSPQLYINYKLKSVEHLPWRALVYRFLNTIIDDLFSFIITMPTMHRIACFRDDIIFVIYLYQRWIYRVDKKRDPYGSLDETEEQKEGQPPAVDQDKDEDRDADFKHQSHEEDTPETEVPSAHDTTEDKDGIMKKSKQKTDQPRKRNKQKS